MIKLNYLICIVFASGDETEKKQKHLHVKVCEEYTVIPGLIFYQRSH